MTGLITKNWKLLLVLGVLLWSLTTLFQIVPVATLRHWQQLSNLPPDLVQRLVLAQSNRTPGWNKMTVFEQEDIIKHGLEEAQSANNIQVLWNNDKYAVVTNLKLGLDLKGGSQLLLQALPSKQVPDLTAEVMRGVEAVISNRVNSLGVSETIVQRSGADRLIVELPGIKDPQQAKDRIGTTALLEFKEIQIAPDHKHYAWIDTGLTGADFKHAQAVPLAGGQTWRILFEFKDEGAKKFADLTSRLVGRQIGIFLDGVPTERGPDGRPLPLQEYHGITVREPILGGNGEITGNFTKEQAIDLAVKLNAGALPVPVKILEERTVGATLGQDSIKKSLQAGGVGIAAVMLFMLAIYRVPGLVADIALILYTITTLAIFKSIPVTLTLAGIAGFILSVGMAVDANILIFERTKEELKGGKNLYSAVEAGFSRAFSSIFDSNINSLIACAVLMMFGTSIVKGFAITLAIGVAVSMFSAITATRVLLHLVPRRFGLFDIKPNPAKPASRAATNSTSQKPSTTRHIIDIVKYRWLWFGISLLITIPGAIAVIMCIVQFHAPLKPGIDFTGGTILQYQFDKTPVNLDAVRSVLNDCKLYGSQVQQAFISNQEVIVMRTPAIDDERQRHKLDDELTQKIGAFKALSVDKVSATIGPELLTSGLLALFITLAMMVLYISYRFMLDYAVCAIVALFHDVLVLCGIFAILGLVRGTEVDSLFISAVLTVIGFSIHDTIVVFDRIRENSRYVGSKIIDQSTGKETRKTFGDVANDSVNQTLARSLYTSLTVIITLSCLYFLGGITTRDFVLAMLIGIISGTYSSIFNASALLVWWREVKTKFRPIR